jgi:dTDP-4-amino-4,6-dideoxygalactose transaminase
LPNANRQQFDEHGVKLMLNAAGDVAFKMRNRDFKISHEAYYRLMLEDQSIDWVMEQDSCVIRDDVERSSNIKGNSSMTTSTPVSQHLAVPTAAHGALAVNNGPRTRTDPWPARRLFGEEEKRAAVELFDQSIAQGEAFGYNGEQETSYCHEFAEHLGGGYADAVNSGSTAVYVALRALDIEPFTEVIVPPISDPGGFMPVPLMNCIPVPADAAPGSYNAGAKEIEACITPLTRAIVVAHIAGHSADMDAIMEIARTRNIPVVEDCAQAHGATYKGRPVGTMGDVAAFSTMFGKHHATGGQGGVVFTKNEKTYWNVRRCADRGKPFGLQDQPTNVTASLNMNQDELACAIGRAQLKKLPGIVEARRKLAASFDQACRSTRTVRLYTGLDNTAGSYWFLVFRIDLKGLSVGKVEFTKAIEAEGIPARPSYLNVMVDQSWYLNRNVFGASSGLPWTCPLYKGDASRKFPLTNVHATDATHINLPIHERCGDREVQDFVMAVRKVEAAYCSK